MEEQQIKHKLRLKSDWEEYNMKKFSKTITAIVGTATLAIGLMALPALAQTTRQQGSAWFGKMQGYMNSTEMQNLHNSQVMQDAMQTGDIQKMQELMNSDPAVKAQMGQENLDRMNVKLLMVMTWR